MAFTFFAGHMVPPESESRSLDNWVEAQEMPYGYTISPPPADTGDYDERKSETSMQSRPKRK